MVSYQGGKHKLSKELCEVLNSRLENKYAFIDAFAGSMNISCGIRKDRVRIANDINLYIIQLYVDSVNGWQPPTLDVTEKIWYWVKDNKEYDRAFTAFVGFGCSFGARFFEGVARPIKQKARAAYSSLQRKVNNLHNVTFYNTSYHLLPLYDNSVIYCDIPYESTKYYSKTGKFDHEAFYEWCYSIKYWYPNIDIFISEYEHNARYPIIWRKESWNTMRNDDSIGRKTVEILQEVVL